jgi:hypothetical protein
MASSRPDIRRATKAGAAAAFCLAGAVGGGSLYFGNLALAPHPCHGIVQISGADTSALSFTITVNLACAVPSGNQLVLVDQLLGEGAAGTVKFSEYYFGWLVKNSPGQQTFIDSPAGCVVRRYFLVSVTQDQLTLLQQSQRTASGSYFGEPIDAVIGRYIISNVQTNHTCNKGQ